MAQVGTFSNSSSRCTQICGCCKSSHTTGVCLPAGREMCGNCLVEEAGLNLVEYPTLFVWISSYIYMMYNMRIYINHLWMVPPKPWSSNPPNKFETQPFSMYSPPTARTFLLGTGVMLVEGSVTGVTLCLP